MSDLSLSISFSAAAVFSRLRQHRELVPYPVHIPSYSLEHQSRDSVVERSRAKVSINIKTIYLITHNRVSIKTEPQTLLRMVQSLIRPKYRVIIGSVSANPPLSMITDADNFLAV